jgi:GT2 family glycosyltransferase
VIDEFGFDPLRDDLMNVLDPDSYRWHTVAQTEFSNPQTIAYRYFNSHRYFDAILAFNGLVHQSEVRVGMRLKIPVIKSETKVQTKVYEL